jgi:hypothetical protein
MAKLSYLALGQRRNGQASEHNPITLIKLKYYQGVTFNLINLDFVAVSRLLQILNCN